jgi:hypothetical protein
MAAVLRRRWSPAARSKGRKGRRCSRGFCATTCRGLGWPEWWSSTRTLGGGGGVNGDDDVPAVNVSKEPAHENQYVMGKVYVESIG